MLRREGGSGCRWRRKICTTRIYWARRRRTALPIYRVCISSSIYKRGYHPSESGHGAYVKHLLKFRCDNHAIKASKSISEILWCNGQCQVCLHCSIICDQPDMGQGVNHEAVTQQALKDTIKTVERGSEVSNIGQALWGSPCSRQPCRKEVAVMWFLTSFLTFITRQQNQMILKCRDHPPFPLICQP